MLKRRAGLLGVLAVIAASAMAACGGSEPSPEEIAKEQARLTKVLAGEVSRRDQVMAEAREVTCRAQVGRAVALLERQPNTHTAILSADLASYSEYVDEIERELSRIPRGSIEAKCLKVVLALGEAESLDQDALKEWTNCIVNDSFCTTTIDFCAVDNPDKGICPPGFPEDLSDDFGFQLWAIVRAGRQMRADWEGAGKKVDRAKALLLGAGTPERTTTALPRSERAVAKSVFGRAAQLLCAGEAVPSNAVEPCQDLRDVLIQGVAADEESDLNAALSGLVDAYQLGT